MIQSSLKAINHAIELLLANIQMNHTKRTHKKNKKTRCCQLICLSDTVIAELQKHTLKQVDDSDPVACPKYLTCSYCLDDLS